MDRRLALAALAGVPLLWAAGRGLAAVAEPLVAGALALLLYWAGLGWALLRWADRDWLLDMATARRPGRLVTVALVLPVLVVGAGTLRLMGQVVLPTHLFLACAIAALAHAVLEEMFWRGALLAGADPTPRDAALALGLFTAMHLGWLGLADWTWGRRHWPSCWAPLPWAGSGRRRASRAGRSAPGSWGTPPWDLFLFTGIAARNWEGAAPAPI
jgi:hypothetical protein